MAVDGLMFVTGRPRSVNQTMRSLTVSTYSGERCCAPHPAKGTPLHRMRCLFGAAQRLCLLRGIELRLLAHWVIKHVPTWVVPPRSPQPVFVLRIPVAEIDPKHINPFG